MSPKDAKRQKPEQLGLPLEGRGEASRVQRSGEASTLANREERSGSDRLMEQVVAITFSVAAAGELRVRIRQGLEVAAAESGDAAARERCRVPA